MTRVLPGRCAACRHFDNDSTRLEATFPGFATMGSGFSSVRDGDGLCAIHDLYLSNRAGCDRFQALSKLDIPQFRHVRGGA
jgi:hypothetical protein